MPEIEEPLEIKEFSAENVESATAKAEEHFGLSRDELTIKVVADEKSGRYTVGLKSRAVILARPRPEAASRVKRPAAAAVSETPARRRPPVDEGRAGRAPASSYARQPMEAVVKAAAPPGESTERSRAARALLEGVLSRLPTRVAAEVEDWESDETVELAIRGDTGGFLIGKEGETLAALTYLLNRMAIRDSRDAKRLVIEAEGYRSDNVASLEKHARDEAAKVRESGEPITLEPMNSYHRRIVHMALKDESGVTTESVGEGSQRSLVIRPVPEA